jgi:hypothetical protein
MAGMEWLGRGGNVVAAASGVHIPMDQCSGITFFVFLDAGTETLTLKESIDGASEQNLASITKYYKGPGVGGTWTKVTQAAGAVVDPNPDDAVNDCISVFVSAAQLSDGFNCVELTASAGQCFAILHDLRVKRAPENLRRSVV